jgi:Tripartite tricarboxylate transporter family receptor
MQAHTSRSTVLALSFSLAALAPAVAQTYPSRPVTLVVPFGAGGPVDTLARILAERMKEPLGQNVLVETVTGASGSLGVGRVVRAPPDGYTVSIGNWPTHVVNGAIMTLPYDLLKDLEPVTLLAANPYVVVARKDLPVTTLPELIAWLQANSDKATEGTGGDAIFGLHNRPGMPVGQFGITPGPAMAGGAFFDIEVIGKGAHGARPHEGVDPVLAACHMVTSPAVDRGPGYLTVRHGRREHHPDPFGRRL